MKLIARFYVQIIWMLIQISLSYAVRIEPGTTNDICMLESFQPQCLKNEVILMKSAIYGRMRIGRCITAGEVHAMGSHFGEDPRYLGCSADVLSILDRKCSGKTECNIRLSDIPDDNIQPCFPGLKMYLEISYACGSIVDEERSCNVIVSKSPTNILASAVGQRICGTKSQPWTIEAPVGQKIAIRLLDFSTYIGQSHGQRSQSCRNSGVVVDKLGKKNVSICVGGTERETELYLSAGKIVDVFFTQSDQQDILSDAGRFLLDVRAVGCSDVIPPEDSWLKRKDDAIVIGCYASRQTWHLRCETGKWVGVLGNCTQDASLHESASEKEHQTTISSKGQVLAIVAIGGFTLAICLTIACVAAVYLRKFYANSKKKQDYKTRNHTSSSPSSRSPQKICLDASMRQYPVNDAQPLPTAQMLTYSVYAGANDFQDVDNSVRIDNMNFSALA